MKLAKREKYLVVAATCCIVIFFLLQFFVFPFFEKRKRIQRGLRAKEEGLKQVVRLASEFRTYQKGPQSVKQSLAGRKPRFTLFSFLEESGRKVGVKAHIKYMKPSISSGTGPYKESMVEMKIEAITLEQLVRYLYRVESANDLVKIKRISISENKKEKGYLDAVMQVITFQ